jgi:rubrerythrin
MEIWSLIREEHQRLEALVREVEAAPGEEQVAHGREELIAHIRAEEQTLDPALLSHSGFDSAVAAVHEENRKVLALCGELAGSAPERWPSVLDAIEVALSGHIEAQNKILPVAEHTLTHHAAEHVKHEFEAAKHALLEGAAGGLVSPELAPAAPWQSDPESVHALERVLRQENESLFLCETAIDLLKHPEYRSLIGEIAEEHLEKAREMKKLLAGSRHSRAGKLAGWTKLYAGAVVGDKATLKIVRSAEEKARRKYERMLRDGHSSRDIGVLLEGLVAAARRHEDQIGSGLESTEKAAEIAG